MASQISTAIANRLMTAVTAMVWRVAGLIGPGIVSRLRDIALLFAGSMPDIIVGLVNFVVLPLITKKPAQKPDDARAK
jgi:hypothetical protein